MNDERRSDITHWSRDVARQTSRPEQPPREVPENSGPLRLRGGAGSRRELRSDTSSETSSSYFEEESEEDFDEGSSGSGDTEERREARRQRLEARADALQEELDELDGFPSDPIKAQRKRIRELKEQIRLRKREKALKDELGALKIEAEFQSAMIGENSAVAHRHGRIANNM